MKKQLFTYSIVLLLMILKSFGQIHTDTLKVVYKNENYKYETSFSKNWKFYEFRKDTINFISRAEWQLPKKYALQENNTILIEAYLKPNLETVDDFYFEVSNNDKKPAGMKLTRFGSNGLEIILEFSYHKEKIYYMLKNGVGYVIKFNATSVTFEKDLIAFENFFTTLKFL